MRKRKMLRLFSFIIIIYTLLHTTWISASAEECVPAIADDVQVGSRLWELFFGEEDGAEQSISLIPGGGIFGVKIKQKYVTVVDSQGVPALKSGDAILSINGKQIRSAEQVSTMVRNSGGNSLTIRALHKGNEVALEIRPALVDGEYKLGLTLRDSAAGLGTITFIDPKTGEFGGLGHGICDAESGEIIAMESGEVIGVILGGINKGESGKPGELRGVLTDKGLGSLTVNSECGVFGKLNSPIPASATPVEIGRKNQVTEGEATIITTLKNGRTAEYKIEIYDIDLTSEGSKSFRIRVTDDTLKALTGGIVRGMSGSPIIQNGQLVGAVTHVMVADPTEGYGIFIENMLNSSAIDNNSYQNAA